MYIKKLTIKETEFAYFDAYNDRGVVIASSTSPIRLIRHGHESGTLTLSEAFELANEFGVKAF